MSKYDFSVNGSLASLGVDRWKVIPRGKICGKEKADLLHFGL